MKKDSSSQHPAHVLARLTAFRDIAEDNKIERQRRMISPADPMGPQKCLLYEAAICEYAGVITKPDFRKFNGGYRPRKQN